MDHLQAEVIWSSRIDFHPHAVPPALPDLADRHGGDWPTVSTCGQSGHLTIGGRPFRDLDHRAWSPSARVDEMQAHGVAMQVLSPIPATLSYTLPADGAAELCARQNEWLAGVVAADREHFAALGAVPLQDPEKACVMIPHVRGMGLSGVEIGTNIAGASLDDPRFDDFFAACAAAGAVVFVHPLDAMGGQRLAHHQLATSIGFLTETAEAAASLVLGGVMDRHPDLEVVLAHGGGAFVPSLPRLDRCWEVLPPARGVCRDRPGAYASRFTYDTLVYDSGLLQHIMGVAGASQLVVGSDYPFAMAEVPAGSRVSGLACSDADRAAIARTNAAALLGLDDASLTPSPS